MVRQYNSSRRKKAAEQTRKDILRAALKLHWEGITEFEPLAREAGCSLATLRKYFPSKEHLFQNCTRTFAESLVMPDLEFLAAIAEPDNRIEQSVSEICRIHDAMFGYAWLGAQQRVNSPTLDATMAAYDGLVDAIAGIITPESSSKAGLLRGLLDFLSYRALHLAGELSPEQAKNELISTVQQLILQNTRTTDSTATRRVRHHEKS